MKKMNFKKILASIGLLAIVVPTTLSVVACGGANDSEEEKTQLSKIVKETNLGQIADKDKKTILKAVEDENPDAEGKIDIKEGSITDTSAVVVPLDKNAYSGEVPVEFNLPSGIPNLSDIVTKTNLGQLPDNKVKTILKAVEDENSGAKGKIEIEEGSITGTEAKIIPSTDEYTGFVKVNFTANFVLPDLGEIVTTKYLGELANNESKTILDKVVDLNSNAEGKIEVENDSITSTQAKIIPSTDEYTGFVTVEFRFTSTAPYLNEIVKKTKLGSLLDNKDITILTKVVELNSNAKDKIKVKSVDEERNLAVIVAINEKEYQGSVTVSFTIGELTEQDVVNAINFSSYFRVILINTKVSDFENSIDFNFIKRSILNEEIKEIFNDELFDLNSIMKNEFNSLTDEDLKNQNSRLATTINYNYGSIQNQNVSLTIEIKESPLPISFIRNWALTRLKEAEVGTPERKDNWEHYFHTLELDFREITFEFTNKELVNDEMIQAIFYEQVRLIIGADLLTFDIEKDYDPATIKLNILDFIVVPKENLIIEAANLVIEILQDDEYVPLTLFFLVGIHYNVIN